MNSTALTIFLSKQVGTRSFIRRRTFYGRNLFAALTAYEHAGYNVLAVYDADGALVLSND